MCRALLVLALMSWMLSPPAARSADPGVTVDKDKRTVTIDAKVAPRKLDYLDQIYPIEVVACWPHPKGKKAHETVVTIEAKPSDVHKALESLGLAPGKPVMGQSDAPPQGPAVKVYLELPGEAGGMKRVGMDKVLVDKKTNKPFPASVQFRFTGSAMSKPNPDKPDEVYGADLTGTLIALFPVTNETVLQTSLTMKEEPYLKLETSKSLPPVGTPVKLVLEVAGR
jgi:hypothetical protein